LGKDLLQDVDLAELDEITRDPELLGHVMGGFIVRTQAAGQYFTLRVDLLRAAGGDEAAARRSAAAHRERHRRLGGGTKP
jgi:hypothetical protein